MGSSAMAKLFFGVQISEDGETPDWLDEFDGNFDEYIVAKFSPIERPPKDYNDTTKELYHQYWDKKRKWIAENCPLDMEYIGTGDYCETFLILKESRQTGDWGDDKGVDIGKITNPDYLKIFKDACARFEIKCGEPKLILGAYYG